MMTTPAMTEHSTLAPDGLGPTVCIGEILVEIMATTVGDGFREPVALVGPYPSGAPAIFIDQCARIGGSAAMVGAVGDDDFGRVNTERLDRDGADVPASRSTPTTRPAAPSSATAPTARAISSTTSRPRRRPASAGPRTCRR